MDRMYSDTKKWIASIQALKLAGLDEDIKKGINAENKYCDTYLLTLLQHLARICSKHSENLHQDESVSNITMSIISHIPVSKKCLASMYHIIQYIVSHGRHEQVKDMIDVLLSRMSEIHDEFIAIAYQWIKSTDLLIKQLNPQNCETLKMIVIQCFRVFRATSPNHSYYVYLYLDKLVNIFTYVCDRTTNPPINLFLSCIRNICSYLDQLDLSLLETKIHETYQKIIAFLESMLVLLIETKSLSKFDEILTTISPIMSKLLSTEKLCYRRLQVQLKLYRAIIKPLEDLDEKAALAMKKYTSEMNLPLIPSFLDSANVIECLFHFWSSKVKTSTFVSKYLTELTNFVTFFVDKMMTLTLTKPCCSGKCSTKTNIYDATALRIKFVFILKEQLINEYDPKLCEIAAKLVNEMAADVQLMKANQCEQWWKLWLKLRILIYQLGFLNVKKNPEMSIDFYCLVCSGIANLEDEEHKDDRVTVAEILRQIAYVYYVANDYDNAIVAVSFCALFNFETQYDKCFHMLTRMKEKNDQFRDFTIISCLHNNQDKIKNLGLTVDLKKYNVAKLCLREIEGYFESNADLTSSITRVLDEMESFNGDDDAVLNYVRGVQLLGLYVAKRQSQVEIKKYVEMALRKLDELPGESVDKSCLRTNLAFCQFIDRLNDNIRMSQKETEAINKMFENQKKDSENDEEEENFILPSFAVIGTKHDEIIVKKLSQVQDQWRDIFINQFDEIGKIWKPKYMLNLITLSAEYAKLYNYHACELLGWKLALKLADILNDKLAYINIVGFLISVRFIRDSWIDKAKVYVEELKNSNEGVASCTIAMFWIKLANYYLKIDREEEAIDLIHKAQQITTINISFFIPNYLELMNTIISNYGIVKSSDTHSEYSYDLNLVSYGLVNLYMRVNSSPAGLENWPYNYSTLFDLLSHLIYNFDSLMPRFIVSHVEKQFALSRSLACTTRMATTIKIASTLHLFKTQLTDCDLKLSVMEKLLDIENKSLKQPTKMKRLNHRIKNPSNSTSPIRDVCNTRRLRTDGSIIPHLPLVTYQKPEFLDHERTCSCYKCKNAEYQSLVFACNSLRAQYFAMKNEPEVALQYFKGAYKIRKIFAGSQFKYIQNKSNNIMVKSFWYNQTSLVEWVLFLLKFSQFYANIGNMESAMEIAKEAIKVCEVNRLKSVSIYGKALAMMQDWLDSFDTNDFTTADVEDVSDILDICEADVQNEFISPTAPVSDRKTIQLTKRTLRPPVAPKKRSPKHFNAMQKFAKVALQEKLEKSTIKIYVDNTNATSNCDAETDDAKENLSTENNTNVAVNDQQINEQKNVSDEKSDSLSDEQIHMTMSLMSQLELESQNRKRNTRGKKYNFRISEESDEDIFAEKPSPTSTQAKRNLIFNSNDDLTIIPTSIQNNKSNAKKGKTRKRSSNEDPKIVNGNDDVVNEITKEMNELCVEETQVFNSVSIRRKRNVKPIAPSLKSVMEEEINPQEINEEDTNEENIFSPTYNSKRLLGQKNVESRSNSESNQDSKLETRRGRKKTLESIKLNEELNSGGINDDDIDEQSMEMFTPTYNSKLQLGEQNAESRSSAESNQGSKPETRRGRKKAVIDDVKSNSCTNNEAGDEVVRVTRNSRFRKKNV